MGSFSLWHWVIVAAVVLFLFGGKKVFVSLMRNTGREIREINSEMRENKACVREALEEPNLREQ